jgi:tetratricopeptide (TPR) repeat protein
MSLSSGKKPRRILPRWRSSLRAGKNADFTSLKAPSGWVAPITDELREQTEDFEHSPSIGTAAELVSTAILAGKPELAAAAASFILERRDDAPSTLAKLASSVMGENSAFTLLLPSAALQIAKTRQLLRINPDNPVLWSDMSRHFASIGDKKQAFRCMKSALALAPNHRWILRTAARFLVHQNDAVGAHKLIATHPRTKSDPWLMAAELACAQVAGRAPKFWKQATDILRRDSFAPIHISELATAVAMMELENDARKRARKLVHKGLLVPTENTLAQIFWAKENRHLSDGFGLAELVSSAVDAYEADFCVAMISGDLLSALDSATIWRDDEPFAARPCEEIAYAASLLDAHGQTIQMAARVKQLDGRSDPSLELNAIFARLSAGKLDKTKDKIEIDRIRAQLERTVANADGNSFHAFANLGLWEYRFGDPTVGREYYQQSIAIAQKVHRADGATLAATFAAREAILSADPNAAVILQQAKALAEKSQHKASEFYLRKLTALAEHPEDKDEILSPASASRFITAHKEVKPVIRVEKTKKGLTIWVPKRKYD